MINLRIVSSSVSLTIQITFNPFALKCLWIILPILEQAMDKKCKNYNLKLIYMSTSSNNNSFVFLFHSVFQHKNAS